LTRGFYEGVSPAGAYGSADRPRLGGATVGGFLVILEGGDIAIKIRPREWGKEDLLVSGGKKGYPRGRKIYPKIVD